VRVLIGGEMVGHIPREDAPALGKMVAMVEGSGGHCGARAVIGWSGSPSDAPIGVRLDLPNPDRGGTEIVLRPLSELSQPEPVPMTEPMTAPALMINAQPDQPESVSVTEPRLMIQSTPPAEPAIPTDPVRTFTGYGVVAEFDGATLRAHGTNKATHFALAGANYDEEVVVPVSTIISVEMKNAGRVGNGNLVVQTENGSRYQLHFLRKHQADFDALATGLRGEPSPGVPAVVESVPMPALLDLPPAAWYPNAEGPGQRYWNGQLWTKDYAP